MVLDVNGSGLAVGGSSSITGMRATLWRNGKAIDLNTLIAAKSGWTLAFASAINDRGQIAGWAMRNGTLHAFRLTPSS
jgi:probable HAF family extracellular repeat protein